MTVGENITIAHLDALAAVGVVDRRAEARAVRRSIWAGIGIKTAGGDAPVTSLSGGNQQKCILARWLLTEPRVLLLDEPTRGIDVGAKAEIYALIRDRLADEGMAILMTSSELPELLAVCDRILVLCEGPAHRRASEGRGDRGTNHARRDPVSPTDRGGLLTWPWHATMSRRFPRSVGNDWP